MRAAAIYHALLRCYPAAFRDEYGEQMCLTFAEQLNDARRTGRRFRQTLVWIEATGDVLTVAPKEHAHVLFQDLRYACRTMAARPGFTAIARRERTGGHFPSRHVDWRDRAREPPTRRQVRQWSERPAGDFWGRTNGGLSVVCIGLDL